MAIPQNQVSLQTDERTCKRRNAAVEAPRKKGEPRAEKRKKEVRYQESCGRILEMNRS